MCNLVNRSPPPVGPSSGAVSFRAAYYEAVMIRFAVEAHVPRCVIAGNESPCVRFARRTLARANAHDRGIASCRTSCRADIFFQVNVPSMPVSDRCDASISGFVASRGVTVGLEKDETAMTMTKLDPFRSRASKSGRASSLSI